MHKKTTQEDEETINSMLYRS